MRNFRLWSIETKRCEAVWLGYFLTLCGCQVWKGPLSNDSFKIMCRSTEHQYIDVLLFDIIDEEFCNRLATINPGTRVWISGDGEYWAGSFWWGVSSRIEMSKPDTLINLMDGLGNLIAKDIEEKESIIKLASAYVEHNNTLVRNIYTINELFCSRQINYSLYRSKNILMDAITQVEEWYHRYAPLAYHYKPMSFSETFAFTYIQNMIDDAYVKARVTGGFDVRVILGNVNYLLKCDPTSDAALFLKLRILRNCINYPESPDEILKEIVTQSAEEYRGRAYCEMGDISRENSNKVFELTAEKYFEKGVSQSPEEYCGLYKLGYLYGQKSQYGFAWLKEAEVRYQQVIDYIQWTTKLMYSIPQEFEYYYKACYGLIKSQIEEDRMAGYLSDEQKARYRDSLTNFMQKTESYQRLYFWNKFYGEGLEYRNALFCMAEKMEKIESLMEQLLDEVM